MTTPQAILTTLSLTTASALQAAVILSWQADPTIVGGHTSMSPDNSNQLDLSSGYNSPASYYPNSTGHTPNFYGAAFADMDGAIESLSWRMLNDYGGGNDSIGMSKDTRGITTSANLYEIIFWTKDEFLAGGDTAANVSLDGMSINTGDNGSTINTNAHFVIRLDSNYYVSDQFGDSTQSFEDPTTITWYEYDPLTDFSDTSGAAASLATSDFDNLTGAGFFINASEPDASGSQYNNVYINNMQVDATVVPEPSSFALAFVAGLGVFWLRRRAK